MNNSNEYFRKSQYYPQDVVKAIEPTHSFKGQITSSKIFTDLHYTKPKYIRIIDNAVEVESVDDTTRQIAQEYFNSCKTIEAANQRNHTFNYYAGMTASLLGTSLGLGALFIPLNPLIPLAFGGAGLFTAGVIQAASSNNVLRSIDRNIASLQDRKDQWNDPINSVIEQRRLVGTYGFSYAFSHNLKNTVVHSNEIKFLWTNAVSKMFRDPKEALKIFNDDLLGESRLFYTWENGEISDEALTILNLTRTGFEKIVYQYRECLNDYKNFEKTISKERSTLENQAQIQRNAIAQLRTSWLTPSEQMYTLCTQEALYLRDAALKPFRNAKNQAIDAANCAYSYIPRDYYNSSEMAYKEQLERLRQSALSTIEQEYHTNPSVQAIQQAYEKDTLMCLLLRERAVSTVNRYFDFRQQALNTEINRANSLIDDQQRAGIQYFSQILSNIFLNQQEEGFLTGPQVIRNWNLSNFAQNPAWEEVYGPTLTAYTLNETISEIAWNQFWGRNGIGRFCYSPISSWNKLFTDRSAFPFTDNWFNLHRLRSTCNRNMFTCNFPVPPPPPQKCWHDHAQVGNRCNTNSQHFPVENRRGDTGYGGTEIRKEEDSSQLLPDDRQWGNHNEHVPVGNRCEISGYGGTEIGKESHKFQEDKLWEDQQQHAPIGNRREAYGYGGTKIRG